MSETGPLKLRAVDADDMAVLAACLQDALVPVRDMRFLAGERRFVLVANRFCWERLRERAAGEGSDAAVPGDAPEECVFERVHCGITFEHVRKVRLRGFDPHARAQADRLMEVLTIMAEDGALTLLFAGGAAVRLEVDEVLALVQDLGVPWPTLWRPRHPSEGDMG